MFLIQVKQKYNSDYNTWKAAIDKVLVDNGKPNYKFYPGGKPPKILDEFGLHTKKEMIDKINKNMMTAKEDNLILQELAYLKKFIILHNYIVL